VRLTGSLRRHRDGKRQHARDVAPVWGAAAAAAAVCVGVSLGAADRVPGERGDIEITPLVHSSVQLEYAGVVVQIDPWSLGNLGAAKPADLILISDDPAHHLDPKAIQQLRKAGAAVVLPPAALSKFPGGTALGIGETRTFAGVTVEAIPAYDIKPGEPSHPRGKANGYLVTLGAKRIYFAGVTECVPEIRGLKDIDVAFMPMNLPLERMTPAATADCIRAVKPKVVYLYHYDQDYASRLSNPRSEAQPAATVTARAESLQTLTQLLHGEPIDVRMADWYPPIASR
jgi:L-ascorbate metabolism protein UlaG (beta-lactamase superfamily)